MSAGTNPPSPPSPSATTEPKPVVRRRRGRSGLYVAVGVVVIVAILVGVGYSTSWFGLQHTSSSTGTACTKGITLQGDGAQIVAPLMAAWTAASSPGSVLQPNG